MFLISHVKGNKFTDVFPALGRCRTQPHLDCFCAHKLGGTIDFHALKKNLLSPSFLGDCCHYTIDVYGEMSYDEVIVCFRKPVLLFFGEFLCTGLHWTPAACIPQGTPPWRDTVVLMIDENIQGIFPFACHYLQC